MNLGGLDFTKVIETARKGLDKARQYAEGLSELEIKVEEATNSEKWGPHGTLMQEITKRSYNMEEYKQILGILARRLHSEPRSWRQIYKSLLLLEYMAKNGPERLVPELKSNGRVFSRLQKFEYIDDDGKDQGLNVRNRAKELWNLVHDDELVTSEREKAAKNRKKYLGHDQSSMFQSMTGGFSASGATNRVNSSTGTATNSGATDTANRLEADFEKFRIDVDDGNVSNPGESPSGISGGMPAPKSTKSKPKLSELSADTSIAGCIAAMAQKFPSPPKSPTEKRAAKATADNGLNLLDFDEPAAATATDTLAQLDALNLTDNGTGEDWADFTSASAPAGKGVGGDDAAQWAPFVSASEPNNTAAVEWDDFSGAPESAAAPVFADPFAPPAASVITGQPSRAALPEDVFRLPAVESIPVAGTTQGDEKTMPPVVSPVKAAESKKDPFADLLAF